MVRTCGSGLKLCMTSLGSDLLSEMDLSIFDYSNIVNVEKKPKELD